MADDPGSESAPRPRRRRRPGLAGAFDLSPGGSTDAVEPVQPDPDRVSSTKPRLPTFLNTPQDATARTDDNILRPSLIVPHVVVSGDRPPSASPGELGWLPDARRSLRRPGDLSVPASGRWHRPAAWRRSRRRIRPIGARPCAIRCPNPCDSRSWCASPRATSVVRATCAAPWSWPRHPPPRSGPGAR